MALGGGVCLSWQTDDETLRISESCLCQQAYTGTLKRTEHYLIVRIGKSKAELTNNRLRTRYCTVEANYRQTRSIARPLCDNRASCCLKQYVVSAFWGICVQIPKQYVMSLYEHICRALNTTRLLKLLRLSSYPTHRNSITRTPKHSSRGLLKDDIYMPSMNWQAATS